MMLAEGTQAAPPVGDLLLDDYPGAVAAYSLRELSTAWAGLDVIRVRESGSNTEQDFNAAEITDGTLATFCGANDGFVVTWYDQSGQGNDAQQSTAANQPKIYDGTTGVVTENGKPAIAFNTTDNTSLYNTFPSPLSQPNTLFFVDRKNNHNQYLFDGNGGSGRHAQGNGTWVFAGSVLLNAYPVSHLGSQVLFTAIFNTTSSAMYIDGSNTASGDVGANSLPGLEIGTGINFSRSMDGTIQEIIVYDSDASSNRTGIESNINTYYSIY